MVSRNIHRRELLGRLIVVRCITVRRERNLDPAPRSWTHLTLPIARHCRIESCLFPRLRRGAGLAGSRANNRQVLICINGGARYVTHLLFDAFPRLGASFEGRHHRLRKALI